MWGGFCVGVRRGIDPTAGAASGTGGASGVGQAIAAAAGSAVGTGDAVGVAQPISTGARPAGGGAPAWWWHEYVARHQAARERNTRWVEAWLIVPATLGRAQAEHDPDDDDAEAIAASLVLLKILKSKVQK